VTVRRLAGLAAVGAASAVLVAGCGSSGPSSSSAGASTAAGNASAKLRQAEPRLPEGVDAIVTTAASRVMIQAQIPKLKAKGIVVSDASSTDPVAPPFIYNTSTVEQNGRIGKYMAAQIVADSKGKADTLYVNLPAYTILAAL
jgi:ABC-type sugar transport system substrate-binding protein